MPFINCLSHSKMSDFKKVLTYGTYYPQAWHHYPHLGEAAVVICDKCRKQPLKRCIGFKEMDLCLTCASAVETSMLPTDTKPVFAPVAPDDPGMVTFMAPEPYYPPSTRPRPGTWGFSSSSSSNRPLTRMAPYERRGPLTKMAPYR